MNNTTRYAAVNAKVRALEGKLLKDEDFTALLSKRSVTEVAEYLKHRTHFSDILEGIDENDIHRGHLESLIKESHINGLEKIAHYFYDEYRTFYRTLIIKYEIEDLKKIARIIKIGGQRTLSAGSIKYLGKYSSLSAETLMSSKSIPDFIRNLRGTLYYEHLRPLLESKVEPTLFNIGMILDLAYFDMIYKSVRMIDKHDRELMNYIVGINADLLNLQWIYRGLKFYNLPPEILFNYTIAYGREFNRDDIKELCYSKHLDEFQKRIVNTKYSFLFDNENTKDIFMERRIYRYLYFKIMIALKKRDGMNIAQAVIYSMLSEVEIRDIISVVENIRYGMAVLEAKKFLIRKL